MKALWLIFAACVIATAGCQSVAPTSTMISRPAASAPSIPLHFASSSRVQGIRVQFDDQRPEFERHYYPGNCEPRNWRDAVSAVPMEAFEPNIEAQLCRHVATAVETVSPGAQHAELTLTSFQYAFDQRESVRGEYQAKYASWSAGQDREEYERDIGRDERMEERWQESENVGTQIFTEILMASFTAVFIDFPRRLVQKREMKKRTSPEEQTLPTEVTDGQEEGLNCRISGVITIIDRDGNKRHWTVDVDQHAPVAAEGSLGEQTARFVEAAMDEFSTTALRSAHSAELRSLTQPRDASFGARR